MSVAVADAGVAVKWFFAEDGSHKARSLSAWDLNAPDLLLAECANVFWRKVKTGEVTASHAQQSCRVLAGSPVAIHATTPERIARALEFAIQLNHPIYDCLYLALALDLKADVLITADDRFLHAARACSASWSNIVQALGQLDLGGENAE